MKLQSDTVQLNMEEMVPLFVGMGCCLLAVGIVLIYKLVRRRRKAKSSEVEERELEPPPSYPGLPPPPIYSTAIATDLPPQYSYDNVVFEHDPPNYHDVISTTQTVIN